jgi:alkylhydroperoxidase family enzyme
MTMSSPRITPVDQPYDTTVAEIFERMMPPGMEPLKLFRTQARNQRVLERMFAGNLLGKGTLSLRERELVILRTCTRCGSEYEWGVHVALFAQRAELDKAIIAATLAAPAQHHIDGNDGLLFDAVDQLHDTASIDEETWKKLSEVCADDKILEIIALVGYYHTIAFITNAAQVELETFAPRFADYADASS